MTTISDAAIAQAKADANQAIAALQQFIALLSPSGTVWSRSAVNAVYSNNDLTVAPVGGPSLVPTTLFVPPSGRYGGVHIDNIGAPGYLGVGLVSSAQSLNNAPSSLAAVPPGLLIWRGDGWTANNGVSAQNAPSYTTGDNIDIYLSTSGKMFGRKNGVWIGDPVAETGALFSGLVGPAYTIAAVFFGTNGSPVVTGQFAATTYSLPAGASLYA